MSKRQSALLDSDSDDSDLDAAPTFRQSRSEIKKRSRGMDYLDEAMDERQERTKTMARIDKIKQEEPSPERNEIERAQALASAQYVSSSERQRQAHNFIHGIDSDADDGFDQGRRSALANLATTHEATLIGTRSLLSAVENTDLFHSKQQAVDSLNDVVQQLEKKKDEPSLVLAKNLRAAVACGMLGELLDSHQLVYLCAANHIDTIPRELEEWLWKLACSADQPKLVYTNTEICAGACETLMKLLKNQVVSTVSSIATLNEIVPLLKRWFGLQFEVSPLRVNPNEPVEAPESGATTTMSNHLTGLKHFLMLLSAYSYSIRDEVAANTIVALTCVGLDRSVHKGNSGVMDALKQALATLLALRTRSGPPEESALRGWMESTSIRIVETCHLLGPGPSTSEDHDDEQAWLCFPLAVRLFYGIDRIRDNTRGNEFMLVLAISALQKCLQLEGEWDGYLKLQLSGESIPFKNLGELPWKALASAYVALRFSRLHTREMEQDSPRCLAIVELARYCLQLGLEMLTRPLAGQNVTPAIYPDETTGTFLSVETAKQVHVFLDLIDSECHVTTKLAGQRASIPDFRRVEFCLSLVGGFVRQKKEEAAIMAGDVVPKKTNKVQKGINSFFS